MHTTLRVAIFSHHSPDSIALTAGKPNTTSDCHKGWSGKILHARKKAVQNIGFSPYISYVLDLCRRFPVTDDAASSAPTPDTCRRKPWIKPEAVVLPTEETETSHSSGDDGNGSMSGS